MLAGHASRCWHSEQGAVVILLSNNKLLNRTVPSNKEIVDGTVLFNKELVDVNVPFISIIQVEYLCV